MSGSRALHPPARQEIAVFVEFEYPGVAVSVGDIDVACPVEDNIGRLIEMSYIIAWNAHPAKRQKNPALGAQFENDVGADVGGPDVVVGIHSHRMGADE